MQESTAFQSVLVYQKVTLIVYHLNNGSLSVNLRLWGEPQSSTQSATVVHTVTAIPKSFIYLSHFFVSNHYSNISTHLNSRDTVQKAVNLTIPGKNRRKMNIIDLNFQIKKSLIMPCRLVWNWPQITFTQPDLFVKCKYPNSYSVSRSEKFMKQNTITEFFNYLMGKSCNYFYFYF